MWKHFELKPKQVEAFYVEKPGSYDLEGNGKPWQVDDTDVYIVRTADGFEFRKGEYFRAQYQEAEDPRPKCDKCGGDLGGNFIGRLENHQPNCPKFPL